MVAVGVPGQVSGVDSSYVSRPRLAERLLRSAHARVALLTAPAGFSKTTCLAEWSAADPRPFAWISASHLHDDPALLIASIVEALDGIGPIDADVLDALATPRPSISKVVLPRLDRTVRAIRRPFVLVIDDAHELTSPRAVKSLQIVIDALPAGSQIALASRAEPQIALARMRANRELVELDKGDLAMTPAESGELLERIGVELDRDKLELLVQRTEGWPAALYLAGLALAEAPDMAAAIAEFAGDDRIVSDYLRDELLSTLTPTRLTFMTRTAVLDELSGPVCDAVLERSGSARVLRELARSNALVVPLDRADSRYRYHRLLADHLLAELRRREPELEPELHSRASRWYEADGDLDRATEHAIAAGELDRAGELLLLAFPALSGRGRIASLERWLDDVDGRGGRSPAFAVASAHRHLALGRGEDAAHWARVAEVGADAPAASPDPVRAHVHLVKATLAADGVARMGSDAAAAARIFSTDSPWQSPCCLYRGVSLHLLGDRDGAVPQLREAVRRGAVASSIIETIALSQLSLIAIEDEDWGEASRVIALAREQVRRCGLVEYPSIALISATSAAVRAHSGEVDAARADIEHATRLLTAIDAFIPWYEVEARLALFIASARLDDAAAGAELVDEAGRGLELTPDAVVLREWLADARGALESAATDSRRGEFALTTAELRTLQYLPSHLSFPEIAERIHVSPNTVKTQARAIYRKLEATSRAEAVERARAARLLDDDPYAAGSAARSRSSPGSSSRTS